MKRSAPHETAVETCARTLRRRILNGDLEPGALLPPERGLADELGVNRTTLRSSLSRLASAGLLQVRQGSGYRVEDYRRSGGPDLLEGLTRMATTPAQAVRIARDLLRVRRHLASAVLEALCEMEEPVDLRPVVDAFEAFRRCVGAGANTRKLATADLAVLSAVVEATGSETLQLCLNPIGDMLGRFEALRDAIYVDAEQSVVAYQGLLMWMEAPNLDGLGMVADALAARDAQTLERMRLAGENTENEH